MCIRDSMPAAASPRFPQSRACRWISRGHVEITITDAHKKAVTKGRTIHAQERIRRAIVPTDRTVRVRSLESRAFGKPHLPSGCAIPACGRGQRKDDAPFMQSDSVFFLPGIDFPAPAAGGMM